MAGILPVRRHEWHLLLAIAVIVLLTMALDAQHNYWNNPRASAIDLVRQWSMLGLFAMGSAVVIISGGIDLSTGSMIAFSGTVCAALLLWLAPEAMTRSLPLPWWAMVAAVGGALASGFLVGSLHAWLITRVGLPPFVATLATLVGLRSLARALCESVTLQVIGGSSTQIGLFDPNFRYLSTSVWIPAVLVLVIAAVLWLLLSRTIWGRHLYALGGNEQAARLSGISVDFQKWTAYCLSSMLASLAGVLYICEQSVADPQTLGRGYELNAIAAAVVGGCSLQGGVGTLLGTMLGALFLRTVIDGVSKIIKTGADVYEGLIVGVVVVFAVVFTQSDAAVARQRRLLTGPLGLVTIVNLTLIAGLFTAIIGHRLMGATLQMDSSWLAACVMVGVASLLGMLRSQGSRSQSRRNWGIWFVGMAALLMMAEQAYPTVQRTLTVRTIEQLGGQVTQDGPQRAINLSGTSLNESSWKQLVARLGTLQPVHELNLSGVKLPERALEPLANWRELRRLDLTGWPLSVAALRRLQRLLPETTILTDAPEPLTAP